MGRVSIPILERTEYPYTRYYDDNFDTEAVAEPMVMICVKILYNGRYIRLSIDPLFLEDSPARATEQLMDALKRISEEGG